MSDIPPLIEELLENIAQRRHVHQSQAKKPRLSDLIRVSDNDIQACHARYDKVHDFIFSFNLSNVQRKFASLTLNVMARTFYGRLFDVHRPSILIRNGWTEKGATRMLRLLSGRRIGKTWVMAIIIAALMLYMSGYTFVVFGPALRQATWVGEKVQERLKEAAPHIMSRMQTMVDGSIYIENGTGKETKLLCLPCNEKVRIFLPVGPLPPTKHSSPKAAWPRSCRRCPPCGRPW